MPQHKTKHSVSVVIPTYNYGRFIAEAIESAIAQTYPILEIVVINDGSTDETEKIVEGFGRKVRYLKQQNAGVCSARNLGIENSSGDLIALLDADDIWEVTKVEKQVAKLAEDEDIGLVHCGMREFNSATGKTLEIHIEGEEGWVADKIALWEKPAVIGPGGSILVRREVVETVGGFDTRLKNGEDWEFCLRVARKYKIGFVPEVLVNYRNHGTNAHLNVSEMERSTMFAWEKAFDTKDEKILRLRRRSYGNLHKVLAGSYFQAGNYPSFFSNAIKSLWYNPRNIGYYLSFPIRKLKRG